MENKIIEKTVKTGNAIITYIWEIDESKPKMWTEGSEYKFNNTLINVVINHNRCQKPNLIINN